MFSPRRAASFSAPYRQRRFLIALLIATLFHLSTITVFRIIAYLPEGKPVFLRFDIVPAPTAPSAAALSEGQLRLGGSELAQSLLPRIDLPTLNFAELNRLRLSSDAAIDPAMIARLLDEPPPKDSWGIFAGSLQKLGASITGTVFSDADDDTMAAQAPPAPTNAHRPAEGWQGYIVWSAGTPPRELLLSPPIQALWGTSRDTIREPIEFVITVDPEGRVVNVWSPSNIPQDLLDALQVALLKYRFSPLPETIAGAGRIDQMGTLFIRPEGEG